jgi:uncharacterized protein YwgA
VSENIKFKRGDYLLLIFYANKQAPLKGRTRLQKTAFLFEKEVLKQYQFDKRFDIVETMDFKPYHYGPFSKKVFQFVDLFENLGLVQVGSEKNQENRLDADIFIDDLLQEDDRELNEDSSEVDANYIPVYGLTEKGKDYVEVKLWLHLHPDQKQALDRLKKNCVETPLKLLLKHVYTSYPDSAADSQIKEEILKETKWQY